MIRMTNSSIKPIKCIVKDPTEQRIAGFYRIIFTGNGHSFPLELRLGVYSPVDILCFISHDISGQHYIGLSVCH